MSRLIQYSPNMSIVSTKLTIYKIPDKPYAQVDLGLYSLTCWFKRCNMGKWEIDRESQDQTFCMHQICAVKDEEEIKRKPRKKICMKEA